MNNRRSLFAFLFVATILAIGAIAPLVPRIGAQNVTAAGSSGGAARSTNDNEPKIVYPVSKKVDVVDDYFGTKVPDPYRWLEDETSAETKAWIDDQNKVTFAYLDKIPYREKLKARLTQLFNYPRISAPFRRGDTYFFTKNDGLQNQSVIYIQKGENGAAEVFLDPNKFSTDGTSVLSAFSLSTDGKYVAYGISQGGSDWSDITVMEVATRKKLADEIKWLKASGVSGRATASTTAVIPNRKRAGSSAARTNFKPSISTRSAHRSQKTSWSTKTRKTRSVFITSAPPKMSASRFLTSPNAAKDKQGNALFYKDLSKNDKNFQPIVAEIRNDSYGVIDNVGDKFLIRTNRNAPNGRVVLVDPQNPDEKNWKDVLPERGNRCRARALPAANSSLHGAKTSRRRRTCLVSMASSRTKSCCRVWEVPVVLAV